MIPFFAMFAIFIDFSALCIVALTLLFIKMKNIIL